MYFLEKTDCSNSNPPFMTYFEGTITQIINKMEDRPLQDLTAKEDEK